MSGELIGEATLEVGANLVPLDTDLAKAERKVATAVAAMQAMLDKLSLHVRDDGIGGGALAGLSAGAATMASSWDTALASVRGSLKDTDRAIGHTAEVTVAASEVEVAAIDKVTRAYLEQAAAARAAADAGEVAAGRALGVDALALAGLRGGGGSRTGAAFATREQRGGGQGLTAAELAAIAGAGIEGVRGKGHSGSRVDPLVVVLEAGRYTPLGGMSAAIGYQGLSGASTTTVAQGGSQGGATNILTSSRTPGEPPLVAPVGASEDRSRAVQDAALAAGVAKLAEAIERPLASPGRPGAAPEALAAVLAGRKAGGGATPGGVILPTGVQAKGSGSDKAVPVIVTETEPKATQAEAAATAAALADLAGREIAPGQRAKAGPAYRAAYEALGYTVASRVPGGPARLYAAGGQPGTGSYGLTAEAAALAAAHGGGSAGGGGGVPPWLAGLLWGSHGGGGGPRLPGWWGTLAGVGGIGAGFGSLGSFAGFGAEHILLTGGGIVGSGVAALGGGALLAGGALGKVGVGMGSDAAVMSSTVADTKQLYDAYENVNKAIRVYGKDSEQAQVATAELNSLFVELGNTAGMKAEEGVAHAAMALNAYWDQATSGARVQGSKILMQVVDLGKAYIPLVAKAAEENLSLQNKGLKPLFEWLKGPEGMGIFLKLESEFREQIPTAMKALDMGFQFFAKTIAAVAPLTGSFLRDLDKFFTRMDEPQNFAKWEEMMAHLIKDFHTWGAFIKELGGALVDLFDKDAHTGEGIIETLTKMLHGVREWEKSVTGSSQIHNLFVVHKEEVIALLEALSKLVKPFSEIYLTLAPPMVKAVTEVTNAIAYLLTKLEKLGPGADWLIGLTLIAAKLKILVPLLTSVGESTGLLAAKQKTVAEMTGPEFAAVMNADAAAAGRLAAAEGAAAAGVGADEDAMLGRAGAIGGGGVFPAKAPVEAAAPAEAATGSEAGGEALTGAALTDAATTGKAALSDALPALLTAGVTALITSMVASSAGAHGTTNTAVSAAVGAGVLGTMLGTPITGVVAAALTAGVVEGLHALNKKAPEEGAAFAKAYYSQFSRFQPKTVLEPKEEETKKIRNHIQRLLHPEPSTLEKVVGGARSLDEGIPVVGKTISDALFGEPTKPPTPSHAARAHAAKEWEAMGREMVTVFELGEREAPHPTAFDFALGARHTLDSIAPAARLAGARSILELAHGMEEKGELPKGSLAGILKGMEAEYPGLEAYLRQHGETTSALIGDSLNLKKAQGNLSQALDEIGHTFGGIPLAYGEAIAVLEAAEHNSNAGIRERAQTLRADLERIHGEAIAAEHTKAQDAAKAQLEIIKNLSAVLPVVGAKGWDRYAQAVREAMESGYLSAQTGVADINKLLSIELHNVGMNTTVGTDKKGNLTFHQANPFTSGLSGESLPAEIPKAHAHGGLIQIGRPGEAGHDTVPLNVGGLPIAVAPGEQVAVFNRHQLPVVNAALAPLGGLPGLFDHITTPNYMASGGIVAPHVGGSGAIPDIVRGALAEATRAANHHVAALAPLGGHGGGKSSAGGQYDRSQLEALWVAAGGPRALAHTAAAIALAESGGSAGAVNPEGPEHAEGLWQIKGQLVPGNPLNPMVSARNAVAKWRAAGGFSPWVTYTSGAYETYMALGGLLNFAHGGLLGGDALHAKGFMGFAHGGPVVRAQYPQRKSAGKLPKGMHFNPFGPIPPVKTSWGGDKAWMELTKMMAPGGPLASWVELYGLEESADEVALTKSPHGGAFVVQPNAIEKAAGITLPYEDPGNVQMRAGQLDLLNQREHGVLNYLTEGWNLSHQVLSAAQASIHERNKAIADLKARIRDNLKKIKELRAAITRQEAALKKLPTGKHATSASRAQAAKLHQEIADEHGQIKSLEDENASLGGSGSEVGTGGNIGALIGQRTELATTKTSTEGFIQEIGGASGRGGKRAEAQVAIAKLAQQMVELGETPTREKEATLEAGAGAGEASSGESAAELAERKAAQLEEKNKFLKEELHISTEALQTFGGPGDIGAGAANAFAAAVAQGGLFTGFGGVPLLPYAGAFGSGGVVPGPIGQAAVAVVHGGEEVRTPDQQGPHVIVEQNIHTLHPGDPTTLTAIGKAATRGIGYQGLRKSKRWKPGI